MRVLLFGSTGLLGSELTVQLQPEVDLLAVNSRDCDLRDSEALAPFIRKQNPDFIINAAAYSLVDRAEDDQKDSWAVNATAPGTMASAAFAQQIPFIHFSTDYVFDGMSDRPYQEQDTPNPLSFYGRSKLEGERLIREQTDLFLILRTSWLYSVRQPCFVTRVLDLARTQPILRMTTDQVGSPTWVEEFAGAVAELIRPSVEDPVNWTRKHAGLYHLAGAGSTSRYHWAKAILAAQDFPEGSAPRLEPALAADFPSPAVRPAYSALSSNAFAARFGAALPPWNESLKKALSAA